jgi:hypothetical protein
MSLAGKRFFLVFLGFEKSDDGLSLVGTPVVVFRVFKDLFKILRVLRVLGGNNTKKINTVEVERPPFMG